jgi:hypothetical protein
MRRETMRSLLNSLLRLLAWVCLNDPWQKRISQFLGRLKSHKRTDWQVMPIVSALAHQLLRKSQPKV